MLNLSSIFWEKIVIEMFFVEEFFVYLYKFFFKVKLYLSIKIIVIEVKQMNVSYKYIKKNMFLDC